MSKWSKLHLLFIGSTSVTTTSRAKIPPQLKISYGEKKNPQYILTNFVKIKRKLSRYRAIQARFQIRSPILIQDILSAGVFLTNARHPRVHAFAAIYILYGGFAKEEEYVLSYVVRTDEIRLWKTKSILVHTKTTSPKTFKVAKFTLKWFVMLNSAYLASHRAPKFILLIIVSVSGYYFRL